MTDQPKWTKGPWAVHSMFKDYVVPHDAASKPIGGSVYDKQDRDYYAQTIVRVVPDRHGRGDANATAHLIAAAPDMAGVSPRAAEMLRVAATFFRSEEPNGTVFYDGAACDAFCIADDCEAAADDIDAALAKARGRA